MNSTDVILKADKIQKIFPSKEGDVRAVDGVDLELRSGEVFGLVGESGCGKSTLSRLLLKLLNSSGGTIKFKGEDITGYEKKSAKET